MTEESAAPRRRRDAAQTRQDLLDVARNRFAHDGYTATTVRDIADEAGVNVALINRYFTSKEGLFEACLNGAFTDVRRDAENASGGPADFAARLAQRLGDSTADTRMRTGLLMMIRNTGDGRTDEIRRSFLRMVSDKLALSAGHDPTDEQTVIRAQILLGTILGIITLRATTGLEPLTTAREDDLREPIAALITALLPRPAGPER